MSTRPKSPREILEEAFAVRADAYRRWREAARTEPRDALRRQYEALAELECDRFERLARLFLPLEGPRQQAADPAVRTDLLPSADHTEATRFARRAAEAERKSWAEQLRRTREQDPQHGLLLALVEEARLARDLVR